MLNPTMARVAYIGLGSNLASHAGPPAQTVQLAANALARLGEVVAQSSLYRTEPVGYAEQPRFANAAMALRTEFEPETLLEHMLAVERSFGRDRSQSAPKGPRTLDLDLLLIDNLVVQSPTLTLPHPALAERRFVLAPLAEIAPGLRHPVLRRTIIELLHALPDAGENRVASVQTTAVHLL